MRKVLYIVFLSVVVAGSVFYFSGTPDQSIEVSPSNQEIEKQISMSVPNKQGADTLPALKTPESEAQESEAIGEETLSSLEESLINDPLFKIPPIPRLFEVVSANELAQHLADLDSRTPLNGGRTEALDEHGNVVARSYSSPQEDEELGATEANRLRETQLSPDELKSLAEEGDAAASVSLARHAYRSQNWSVGDENILRAARDLGKPAPLTIAANTYRAYSGDDIGKVLAAAWYIAAFIAGDYTTAGRLRLSFGILSPELQEIAIDQAIEILEKLEG